MLDEVLTLPISPDCRPCKRGKLNMRRDGLSDRSKATGPSHDRWLVERLVLSHWIADGSSCIMGNSIPRQ